MLYEIERKYLVKNNDFEGLASKQYAILQGYICNSEANTVRIRKKGDQAFITIKGASSADGLIRPEWEQMLDTNSFEMLWQLCLPGKIEKTRYEVQHGNHCLEVDVFHGDNEGLIVAEIELKAADEVVEMPDWVGEEVTGIAKYYNSQLAVCPYKDW
ncbi:MAG: CYTH domain-containing protein [Chitinophagales bacterium]|nr:CYTH domain-containing protein [Chitinophagales bacterium]